MTQDEIIESLETFFADGLIAGVEGVVKSGKEATVLCCRAAESLGCDLVAAKVYRPRDNRNFRNEGLSTRHNPEFTMIEFYEAYRDYRYMMDFTERLFREVALKVLGTTVISYQGKELDLGQPFHRLTIAQAIQKYHPQFTDALVAYALP